MTAPEPFYKPTGVLWLLDGRHLLFNTFAETAVRAIDFTTMVAAFNAYSNPSTFPVELLVEHRQRLKHGSCPRHGSEFQINGTRVVIVRDQLERCWLLCDCGRRCKHLYLPELKCRICLNLDYSSRHLHRSLPAIHRVMKLRRMAGLDPKPFTKIPRKQRRYKRYARLVARILIEEEALRAHMQKISHDLERRARLRGLGGA